MYCSLSPIFKCPFIFSYIFFIMEIWAGKYFNTRQATQKIWFASVWFYLFQSFFCYMCLQLELHTKIQFIGWVWWSLCALHIHVDGSSSRNYLVGIEPTMRLRLLSYREVVSHRDMQKAHMKFIKLLSAFSWRVRIIGCVVKWSSFIMYILL